MFNVVKGLNSIVSVLNNKTVDVAFFDVFCGRLVEILCQYNLVMPSTEHAMIVQFLLHVSEVVKRLGPSFPSWMYPFESFVGQIG